MVRIWRVLFPVGLFLAVLFVMIGQVRPISAVDWQSKVDSELLEIGRGVSAEFVLILDAQADLTDIPNHWTKEQKGQAVYDRLTAMADATQPEILAQLGRTQATTQSFWVTNMIHVRGESALIEQMARRSDIRRVVSNQAIRMNMPAQTDVAERAPNGVEWNITKINAPAVWEQGFTGQGVVIAGQDTGYDWDHAGLINQYRGWNGITVTHDYNWHDAIRTGNGGSCGLDSAVPCDDYGHGTHTMGTMVGNDLSQNDANWPAGADRPVGVAPGADWIACRNMDVGNGTPTTYAECYQWFLAPTDRNGDNPDVTRAPHVINNSWACTTGEGCTVPDVLLSVAQSIRAAGIVNVVSAGNSGACGSISTPSAIYDESFTVGSTTDTDALSGFSSRGPVTVDGSNRLKPDISAPGSSILSTTLNDGYGLNSGTSMAGPHVAGLVALMISADPMLAGQIDLIESIIRDTAVQLTSPLDCGAFTGSQIPNVFFGYGRIDAQAAISRVIKLSQMSITTTLGANNECGSVLYQPLDPLVGVANICFALQNGTDITLTHHAITDSLGHSTSFTYTLAPQSTYIHTRAFTFTEPIKISATWVANDTPQTVIVRRNSNIAEIVFYRMFLPNLYK